MKKILVTVLACAMVLSMAACGKKDDVSSSVPVEDSSSVSQPTDTMPEPPAGDENPDEAKHYEEETKKVEEAILGVIDGEESFDAVEGVDGKLNAAYEAVKKLLGENYIPSMAIENAQLGEIYGIPVEDIESVIAEGPMMSTHVDTIIAIKAKEGKGEAVETALNTFRDKIVADKNTYPMNMPKVEASKVIRSGDYVFFTMLGAYFN